MALITPVEPENLVKFLEKYGISDFEAVKPLAAGSVNSNFEIRSGQNRNFLRIYEEQDLAGARRDAETVAALASSGVPTPAPLERSPKSGADHVYVSELEGKPAALFPWKDGEIVCQKRVTASHVASVGAALATTHRAGSGLASRYGAGRFRTEDLRERISRIAAAADPRISKLAPRLSEALESCSAARSPDLPKRLAHGDLFRDNVLFVGGAETPQVLALLDFESAFKGTLMFDLMVTLLAWCVGDGIDYQLAHALCDGYRSMRPLEAVETKNAFHEARFAAIRFWITRVTDYAMRLGVGNGRDPRRFEMRLAQLDALGSEKFERAVFG
ncbi:MAG: homoserine kinase [Polyangiaceae bacterium]